MVCIYFIANNLISWGTNDKNFHFHMAARQVTAVQVCREVGPISSSFLWQPKHLFIYFFFVVGPTLDSNRNRYY